MSRFPATRAVARLLLWPLLYLLPPAAPSAVFTNDTLIDARSTYYEGADIVVTHCTLTVDGPHSFASLLIGEGGKLTHSFAPLGLLTNASGTMTAGLNLTISGDVEITTNGAILADGIGYAAGQGAGHGTNSRSVGFYDGSGAGYGGSGGNGSSNAPGGICYGSWMQPTNLGSGGGASYAGPGANGGGAIQIVASGNFRNDGLMSADGATPTTNRAGAGSGGSIWITASTLSGAGTISACGGNAIPSHGGRRRQCRVRRRWSPRRRRQRPRSRVLQLPLHSRRARWWELVGHWRRCVEPLGRPDPAV